MFSFDPDNPYWEMFKYAFVIAGGAAVAGGVVAGGFKIVKKGMGVVLKENPTPVRAPVEVEAEVEELTLDEEDSC